MNPFDPLSITPLIAPVDFSPITPAESSSLPYVDIAMPITRAQIPESLTKPYEDDFGKKKKKENPKDVDVFLDTLHGTKLKDKDINYTYSSNLDTMFKDLDYNPNVDMDALYDSKQSFFDVVGKQSHRFWLNMKNQLRNDNLGQGRYFHDLSEGDINHDAFFNQPETVAAYLESVNEDAYNPIFGKDNAAWYSMKGWLGDQYASSGFTAASVTGAIIDNTFGQLIKSAFSNPITGAIAAVGIGALFNNTIRDTIGEDNANIALGVVGGGATSALLQTGINKLVRMVPAEKIPLMKNFVSTLKTGEVKAATRELINGTVKNLIAGTTKNTLLDVASTAAKTVKTANTIGRGLKGGLTLGKMYLSSGSESGLEAIQAQYDYIGNKIKYGVSEEEYKKIYADSLELGKNVYNLNRILLGTSNFLEFGDIVTGAASKNFISKLGVSYLRKEAKYDVTGSHLKNWLENTAYSSVREGLEEGSQYAISEGAKHYANNRALNDSKADAAFEGIKKTVTTAEGWNNIISGMFMSFAPGTIKGTYKGIKDYTEKGTFDSFKSGYTGFSKDRALEVVDLLEKQIKHAYTLTQSPILDVLQRSGTNTPDFLKADFQKNIDSSLNEMFIRSIEAGTDEDMKFFLEDYFSTEDKQTSQYKNLLSIYGTDENINKVKVELTEKFDKTQSLVKNFQEFYTNPYTVGVIDSVVGRFKKDTADKNEQTKIKAQIYNDLVAQSTRTLYLQQEDVTNLMEFRKQIDPFLNKFPIDVRLYLDPTRNNYEELEEDLDLKIEGIKTDLSLGNLKDSDKKKREKELQELTEFKDKLSNLVKLHEKEVDKIPSTVSAEERAERISKIKRSSNPISQLIYNYVKNRTNSKKISSKLGSDISGLNIRELEYGLSSISRTEESLYFLSRDLQKLTSEDGQKEMVEFLYSLRDKHKKNITTAATPSPVQSFASNTPPPSPTNTAAPTVNPVTAVTTVTTPVSTPAAVTTPTSSSSMTVTNENLATEEDKKMIELLKLLPIDNVEICNPI